MYPSIYLLLSKKIKKVSNMMPSNNKIESTAVFTGHRNVPKDPNELITATEKAVIFLIEQGVKFFGSGGAIGFDCLASELILKLRKTKFPQIKLIQVLPFKGMESLWTPEQKERFYDINNNADKVVWLAESYTGNDLYHVRNRYLVDHSAYLIAYCTNINARSGTASCYRYAVKQNKRIILINDH